MDRDILTTSFLVMDDSSSSDEPLTPLTIQFLDESIYEVLMASSDVDQKLLGKFAQQSQHDDPLLSKMLYKILGLSVLLSRKLFRARRLRRLDVTRDTKSLQLYHHIIWLSREGLVILEEYVIPLVQNYAELKVLAHKLRGSFYHIFVLFHNQPSVNKAAAIPSAQQARASTKRDNAGRNTSIRRTPPHMIEDDEDPLEQTAARTQALPPGLAPISIPKPAASFLLPAVDYIPNASACFERAMSLATNLLSGSHPLRLSVAVEYCAYRYDCLHDGEGSRKLAQATIRAVYNATEGMSDETFTDSANLVGVLGKMMKRGLGSNSAGGTSSSVGRTEKSSTPDYRDKSGSSTAGQQRQNSRTQATHQQPRPNSRSAPENTKDQKQRQASSIPKAVNSTKTKTQGTPVSKFSRTNAPRPSKLTTPWEAPPSPEVTRKGKPTPAMLNKDLPPSPQSSRNRTSSSIEASPGRRRKR